MTSHLDEALRDRLRAEVAGWRPSQDFEAATVARALQARRRRRSLGAVAGLTTVALALSGAMLSGVLPHSGLSRNDVASHPSTQRPENSAQTSVREPTSSSSDEPLRWARGLPSGPPPTLPFEIGNTVFDVDQRTRIPADGGGLVGRVEGGWLVLEEHGSKGRFWSRYGILRPSGSLDPLPVPDAWNSNLYPAAVSPDGQLVAYQGLVADVRAFEVVGQLPVEADYVFGWSPVGIVYETKGPSGQQELWQLGSDPVQLTKSVGLISREHTLSINRDGACGGVYEVARSGSVEPVLEGCAGDRPVSVSENGIRVLLHSGEVVDISTNERFESADIPTKILEAGFGWQPVWEGNDAFLFVVEGEFKRHPHENDVVGQHTAIVVRCLVSRNDCEQAGPELRPDATDELMFDFFK